MILTEVPTLRWHRTEKLGGLRCYFEAFDDNGRRIGRVNQTWQQGASKAIPAAQVFTALVDSESLGSYATVQEAQEAITELFIDRLLTE